MPDAPLSSTAASPAIPSRRPWTLPRLAELPKLSQLTLASAIGGGGGTGGGGSTVFGLVLAVLLGALSGCSSDHQTGPGEDRPGALSQAITCVASVSEGTVECAGPQHAPGSELIGGQGMFIALRNGTPSYDGAQFTFDVTVQNLGSQVLGSDGTSSFGFHVFFNGAPVVTSGSGTITTANEDGFATFVSGSDPYFEYAGGLAPGATSSAKTWILNVPNTVNSFTFTVLVSAMVPVFQGVLDWNPVPEFSSHNFIDIAVNSPDEAMAVGYGGITMRKRGGVWERLPVQIAEDWIGVEAIGVDANGAGRYIGATTQGTIARFERNVWRVITTLSFDIETLSAYGDSNLVAGGQDALYWRGSNFSTQQAVGSSQPWSMSAIYNGGSAFVVATGSGSVRWGVFSSSTTSALGASPITTLAGTPGSAFPIGGKNNQVVDPILNTNFGTAVVGVPITALTFGAGGVGAEFWSSAWDGATATIASRTAGAWTVRGTVDAEVKRMVDDSAGGIYILTLAGLHRWNGAALVDELVAPNGSDWLYTLASHGGNAMIGTGTGLVHRYHAGGWTTTDVDPLNAATISGITMFGPVFAAAIDTAGGVHEFDGATWSQVATLPEPVNDILGFGGADLIVVGGHISGGAVHRRVSGSWGTTINPGGGPSAVLRAVWGTGVADFWVVGDSGKVVRYSGGVYTLNGPVTSAHLYAVTGSSNADVWVAGSGGYIAHWDGATWTACTLGSQAIRALWSPAPGVVYAAADSDSVVWKDANCLAQTVGVPYDNGGVWDLAGSVGNVWALKGGRVYRGRR